MDERGVMFVITQADTGEVRSAFEGYDVYEYEVYRPGRHSYVTELIITNF